MTALEKGTYRIRVKMVDEEGIINNENTVISVTCTEKVEKVIDELRKFDLSGFGVIPRIADVESVGYVTVKFSLEMQP